MPNVKTLLLQLLDREQLPRSLLPTIQSLYEPLASRIALFTTGHVPLVVGICGPQGSGKTTLTAILQVLLQARELAVAALSLDDLYLTRAEREQLAATIHPLLRTRGVPGTHDVSLGMAVLDSLAQPGVVALPSFDKSIDERRPEVTWPRISTPVDVVLFEGWCVGARPQPAFALHEPVNELERTEDRDGRWRRYVNDALGDEYQSLFARIDHLIFLKASNFEVVFKWRSEQEQKLRARMRDHDTLKLMDDQQLQRFISHYERLTRHMMVEIPARADVLIELDNDRVPVRISGS